MYDGISQVKEHLGNPRILVNCAGIAPAKRIVGREGAMPLDDFRRVIEINLIGTFNAMRCAAEIMTQLDTVTDSGERGVIICTASVAAYEGQIGQAAYASSKERHCWTNTSCRKGVCEIRCTCYDHSPRLDRYTYVIRNASRTYKLVWPRQYHSRSVSAFQKNTAKLVEHIITNEMLNGDVIRLDGAIRLQPT